MTQDPARIRGAWQGRVSGCMLGKPLGVLSLEQGRAGLVAYLEDIVTQTVAVAREFEAQAAA